MKSFVFAYYEKEDIYQECWAICLEVQDKFDPLKGSLYSFLYMRCYQRLQNIWRNKYRKLIPPCKSCHKNYLRGSPQGCSGAAYCTKYNDWVEQNRIKQRVCCPNSIGTYEPPNSTKILDKIVYAEAIERISASLTPGEARLYESWLDGQITSADEEILLSRLKEVLDD